MLCCVSVTRVTVLHLCGTHCMGRFGSVTVTVGVRQTPLLQSIPSSLSIKKRQFHTQQHLILAFPFFNGYINFRANTNRTWKLPSRGHGNVEERACVNQLQLRGFVGNLSFCCCLSEHLYVLLFTLHVMLKSRALCCLAVPRNSMTVSCSVLDLRPAELAPG